MTDKRPLLILIVVAGIMAALFYVTQSRTTNTVAANDDSGVSSSSTSSSTTSPTSTSVANPSQPPVATGNTTDWPAGLKRVNDLENAAFQAPDPSKVGDFMTRNCSCFQDTVTRLSNLKNDGEHVAGDNIVIKSQQFVAQEGDNRVKVVVSLAPAGKPVVDASGKVVEASPSSPGLPYTYTLEKGTDGTWRLADRVTAGAQ